MTDGITISSKYNKTYIFLIVPFFFIVLTSAGLSIDENAYFYTLSTVAQTMAAIIGISGAFAIFQITILETKIDSLIEALRYQVSDFITQNEDLVIAVNLFANPKYEAEVIKNGKDRTMVKEATKSIINGLESTPARFKDYWLLERNFETLKSFKSRKNDIFQLFKSPLKYGAIAIISSIILLPLGNIIYPENLHYAIFNLSKLKLVFVGVILYFAFVSIVKIIKFLEELLLMKSK